MWIEMSIPTTSCGGRKSQKAIKDGGLRALFFWIFLLRAMRRAGKRTRCDLKSNSVLADSRIKSLFSLH